MKRTPALPMLLAGLVVSALARPATAQTPLLEIDYQNATVFHVLSDGRLLLPLGAADGYVLTTDGDGYATWQAASGTGGAVTTDATLTGDGTPGAPLGVAVPLVLTGMANGIVQAAHDDGNAGTLGSIASGVLGLNANGNSGTLGGIGSGVFGVHSNGNFGHLGRSDQGAYGQHNNGNFGYFGDSQRGAYGEHANGNRGTLGGFGHGVIGVHANGHTGFLGGGSAGAYGAHTNGHFGRLGDSNYGAYGEHANGNSGWLGSVGYAVFGVHSNGSIGYLGSTHGAYGEHANDNRGWLGSEDYGAFGINANSNYGFLGGLGYGAYAEHANGHWGALGTGGEGVYGENSNGNYGFLGGADSGVYGESANGNGGGLGLPSVGAYGLGDVAGGLLGVHIDGSDYGVYGFHVNENWGALGTSNRGVYGENSNGNRGLLAGNNYGAYGRHNNGPWGALGTDDHAGYFSGDVAVTGTLSKGGGSFKIDHPLDPEGKYLAHSFVESPDMMNVYNGNAVLDAQGEAVVELPSYFEALNRDFRYQLTCIGGFAPVYVAEKVSNSRFKIAGGQPGMEVSWQVTGIRQDRWAAQNRIVVEEDKPAIERGYYLHPALYGRPEERSIEWARDPEGMRAMQERPAQVESVFQRMQAERERMKPERAARPPSPDNEP